MRGIDVSPSRGGLLGLGGYRGSILAIKTTPPLSFSDPALALEIILSLVEVFEGRVRHRGRPVVRKKTVWLVPAFRFLSPLLASTPGHCRKRIAGACRCGPLPPLRAQRSPSQGSGGRRPDHGLLGSRRTRPWRSD